MLSRILDWLSPRVRVAEPDPAPDESPVPLPDLPPEPPPAGPQLRAAAVEVDAMQRRALALQAEARARLGGRT